MKFAKESCWHWMMLVCKAYIVAVPAALLICQFIWSVSPSNKLALDHMSYWDLRIQARIIEEETAKIFQQIEIGYCVCLVGLLVEAVLAACARNKTKLRPALIFAALAVVSMAILYPATVIIKTR